MAKESLEIEKVQKLKDARKIESKEVGKRTAREKSAELIFTFPS